jgi:hypothetical protein
MFEKKENIEPEENKQVNISSDKTVKKKPKKKLYSRISAVSVFPNTNIAAKFWFRAFIVLFAVFLTVQLIQKFQIANKQSVAIMTSNGRVYVAPLIDYNEATPMHEMVAKYAAWALLNRNPNGFDEPKLLKQIYAEPLYRQVLAESRKSSTKFLNRDIHQKCEITHIIGLRKSQGYVMVKVVGQLIRTGRFQGQAFNDGFDFELDLKLIRNPDLGSNMRLPYIVDWLSINLKPIKAKLS